MKRVYCLLSFFIGIISLQAQNPALKVYVLKSDTGMYQELDSRYWQVMDDPDGKLHLEDILKEPLNKQFYQIQLETDEASSRASAHWFRYKIRNDSARTFNISFFTGSQQADFYVFEQDRQTGHLVTGNSYPWHKKAGLKKANAVPWAISPGKEILVYQRRFNDRPDNLRVDTKIRLYNTEKLKEAELTDYEENYIEIPAIYKSFISGLLLLACIFNFLLFWQLKDRASLYFSLMLFCFFFLYNSFLREVVGRENHIAEELFNTIGISFIIFFLLFVREYFEVYKTHPRWNKFLVIYSIILFVLFYMDYLIPNTMVRGKLFQARSFVIMGYLISTAITVIICFRTPGKKRKIFAIAILPFVFTVIGVVILLSALSIFKLDKAPNDFFFWEPYILGFFMVWATIVFSSYLYKNYGQAQRRVIETMLEKEKMAREEEQHRAAFMEKAKIQLESEVETRTAELKSSLEELKSTQAQLIQAEKMASLGELTAGIAHEIQNPLNFVNNFSEVNTDLIADLKDEIRKGNLEEVNQLADDIAANEEKISHHGKRAEAIIKSMLQHSRNSTGAKEPTNLNELADEYLRLTYHGLRARDKNFNVTINTDFDLSMPQVQIVPQDIGRVLLNLFNNAFYAVAERAALHESTNSNYHPMVTVTTKRRGVSVELVVQDNGKGISPANIDKIFQPFFTTKPTGKGTGLGLSLSYDIITKAHGGSLKAESMEGEFAKFVISLPLG